MQLVLDVGNSQIFGGVYNQNESKITFRKSSQGPLSADEFGIFLKSVLRENLREDHQDHQIDKIGICSVVPEHDYSIKRACLKYFNLNPLLIDFEICQKHIQFSYPKPEEIGADRMANAVAVSKLFPSQNRIIVDMGTATTFCVLNFKDEYVGGCITAGLKISIEALGSKTSKLSAVPILKKTQCLGSTTEDSIQSGLYFGQLGQMKEIVSRLSRECFPNQSFQVIGTGGFAYLFENENLFSTIIPDLVLRGVLECLKS